MLRNIFRGAPMEIYLDNAATTKPCKLAVDAVIHTAENAYGNPSSLHRKGFISEKKINVVRDEIADLLMCRPEEIYFTSGATESNNIAIMAGVVARRRAGNHIIISAIEHPSVIECTEHLKILGYQVSVIYPSETGEFRVDDFAKAVTPQTALVSCMLVNNEVGTILPIIEIARQVKNINEKVVVHCDAVQAFLKMPIKLRGCSIDILSFSAHKVGGFKGVGGLYIRREVKVLPLIHGGAQQNGMRPGTEPVELIAALGAVVNNKATNIAKQYEIYRELNLYLREKLEQIPSISINSTLNDAPYIINFSVQGIRSEIMLHFLAQSDIFVSSGSACSKGKENYVLSALGKSKQQSDTAIRVSFCEDTTKEMLDILTQQICLGIDSLAKTK